jgi:vacuolar-type H+-ATPase subunit I/STV1
MAKPLSQQLADLSARAKNAEDAVAAAKKEAHEKIDARKEQARAAATKAAEKVNQDIKSVGDTAVRNWTAIRTKIAADIDSLKAGADRAKHDLDARHAERHAERLEWEAGVAIDYAIASIEQAKLSVLDAVSSRVEAEKAKASQPAS